MIDNTEDFDIAMAMYNLLEYSNNYFVTSETLWNYYWHEIDDIDNDASEGNSFTYKAKEIAKT